MRSRLASRIALAGVALAREQEPMPKKANEITGTISASVPIAR
jgi:hypothetical protein